MTAPQNLELVSKGVDFVEMEWDAAVAVSDYEIERNGAVVASEVTALTFTDTGLSPATEYTHRVRGRYFDALIGGTPTVQGPDSFDGGTPASQGTVSFSGGTP